MAARRRGECGEGLRRADGVLGADPRADGFGVRIGGVELVEAEADIALGGARRVAGVAGAVDRHQQHVAARAAGKARGVTHAQIDVAALARLGAANARELIAAELARDSTDEGRKGGFNAEAQLPDGAVKNKWFRRITRSSPEATENKLAAGDLREAMELFAVPGQEPLLQSFVDPYFSELVALAGKGEDNMYLQRMSEVMYPSDCAPALIEKTTAFLKAHPELPAGVIKSLRVRQQEVGICLKLQAL